MNDEARNTDCVPEAIDALAAVGRAKQAATHNLAPRQPVRLDPDQLAEAYRRAGIRNPRAPQRAKAAADA